MSSSSSSYSSSLHFLPTTNITGGSHRRSTKTTLIRSRASSPPPTTAPSEPSATKSNSRLDPRVEKRGGGGEGNDKYWVLKEEYRQGINPQEKIKLGKEPMGLFMDGGINELASIPFEEIEKNKVSKDDVDVRLKWLGLFHRRKHQYGRFMMRLKLPNGVATSDQVRYLADVISAYGTHGCADVTTRQNFQIRGVELPDVPQILSGLASVKLNSLQSGMDNVRNPVGNPLAGIDPDEIVDTRPYAELLSKYITGDGKGNPDVTNLPRKWNVCIVGSHDLYEHPHINDLAYMPAMKDGRFGFNLLVGGFISPKRCAEAVPMDAWVSGDDVVAVCKAILETYRDLGTRGNRQKTRMMWLIDELGIEVFRSEVEQRMPEKHLERSSPEDLVKSNWVRKDYIGVHQQKQPDLSFVGLSIPVGRLQSSEMYELARLADSYGTGELRLTVEQNVIIPNIPNSRIQSFLSEPLFSTGGRRITPEPEILMRNLVACTGSEFCGQAIIETKARAMRITEEVGRRVAVGKAVRMHWTGCPNSCGQVQVADLGFMGCMTKDSQGRRCEGADVYVGGKVGGEFSLGELYKKGVACDELVDLIVDILIQRFGAVKREREEDQDD